MHTYTVDTCLGGYTCKVWMHADDVTFAMSGKHALEHFETKRSKPEEAESSFRSEGNSWACPADLIGGYLDACSKGRAGVRTRGPLYACHS